MSEENPTPKKPDIEVSAADSASTDHRKIGRAGKSKAQKARHKPAFNSVVHPRKTDHSAAGDPQPGSGSGSGSNQKNSPQSSSKKMVSWPSAVSLALISTLVASTVGWVGPALFKDTRTTDSLRAMNKTLEDRLASEITARKALETTTKTTAQTLQAQTHQSQTILAANDDAIGARLDGLETLSGTLGVTIDDLGRSLSLHSAALFPNYPDPEPEGKKRTAASLLLQRITNLEVQTNTLQTQLDTIIASNPRDNTVALSGDDAALRIETGSTADTGLTNPGQTDMGQTGKIMPPSALSGTPASSTQDKRNAINALRASFPRAALIQAVQAQDKQAAKKPSWLQSLLSKHIKVRDDETPQLTHINAAQAAIGAGNLPLCLTHISKLNPPVRAAAPDWIKQAKKVQKTYFDTAATVNIGQ